MRSVNASSLRPHFGRQHVVLLGAGASKAALPDGDRNGRRIPLLNELVEFVGLEPILKSHGVTYIGRDFEALYSQLVLEPQYAHLVRELEEAILKYFAALELPDNPTLYDHLVLSLRAKDCIATFNWDPFLQQALRRNDRYARAPTVLYLHGNVAVGYCAEHKPVSCGPRGERCRRCGRSYTASRLLYPVTQKDYTCDPLTDTAWRLIRSCLEDAYILTIFGYSAPTTDANAMSLLRNAWGNPEQRVMEEIELIDIKSEDELVDVWRPFIHSHHYQRFTNFYKSSLALAPRRSCEATFARVVDCAYLNSRPFPIEAGWRELYAWLGPLIEDERSTETGDGTS